VYWRWIALALCALVIVAADYLLLHKGITLGRFLAMCLVDILVAALLIAVCGTSDFRRLPGTVTAIILHRTAAQATI
jgi:hypothetical protein